MLEVIRNMPNPLRDYWIEFMLENVPHTGTTLPESFSFAFFLYFDYTLCINMEYSFTSFVPLFVLFDGGWDVSGPLPGGRVPGFAKVCPPPSL